MPFGRIPTVKLLLNIFAPDGPIPFVFLFDTGADVTSFPANAADRLGISLPACRKVKMTGYEGTTVWVWQATIKILFGKQSLTIPCVFHPQETVPLLLGRAGILSRFTITLDAQRRHAVFRRISKMS